MSNAANCPRSGPIGRRIRPQLVHPLPSTAGPASAYRPWIELSGSMTRALGAYLGETPAVTPTFEGPGRLAPWEARLLRTRGSRAYVREVTLSVRGQPVLAARTLSLLNDPAVEVLRRLSNRPLAEVLFQDRDWGRLTAPIPVIDLHGRRFGRAGVWGHRGRRWDRAGSRILVTEYFEPVLAAGPTQG